MNNKKQIEIHITDIILFDIVGYSLLSDEDQYKTISIINTTLKDFLLVLFGQSFLNIEEVVIGVVPTGDGAYIILNHQVAGYGLFLALSLRSKLLLLKKQSNDLFSGLRTATHYGTAIPIEDLNGNKNFVGTGLNDCTRLLSIEPNIIEQQRHIKDENYIIVSSAAYHQFREKYSGKEIEKFLRTIKFEIGNEVTFLDKHKKEHKAYFVDSSRFVAITPTKPKDIEKRLKELSNSKSMMNAKE